MAIQNLGLVSQSDSTQAQPCVRVTSIPTSVEGEVEWLCVCGEHNQDSFVETRVDVLCGGCTRTFPDWCGILDDQQYQKLLPLREEYDQQESA